jgi:DNA polymerase-3 subunit gamma/tau
VSLYRKWRPLSFNDLVGQGAVVRTLSQALLSGRLVHAYLFSGPRGSGKTSAAKIMARCIDCEHGPTPTPDNTCLHCAAILAGTALDVVEIDAASNRGIDEIRALRESVKFAPAAMRKKVYIVDEVHMLTKEGANAFLKTLEEPPDHVVFILATTAPEALPLTILSRCQRYAFRRIAVPVMVERMRLIAEAEGILIDAEALGAIAYRAEGGLRDALTMLEQASAFAEGKIDLATIEIAFGATGRAFARAMLDAFIANNAPGVMGAIEEAAEAGTDMAGLTRNLITEIRNVVVARIDPGLLARDTLESDAEAAKFRATLLPQARALRALRLLSEALNGSRLSGNPRLELESAMLRLTLQGEDPSLEALATRLRLLEEGHGRAPAPAAVAVPRPQASASIPREPVKPEEPQSEPPPMEEPPNEEPPTLQRVKALWAGVRARAEASSLPLRGPLSRAEVTEVTGWTVTLRIGDEQNAGFLRDRIATLEKAMAEVFSHRCKAVVQVGSASGRSKDQADPAASTTDDLALLDYAIQRLGGTGER